MTFLCSPNPYTLNVPPAEGRPHKGLSCSALAFSLVLVNVLLWCSRDHLYFLLSNAACSVTLCNWGCQFRAGEFLDTWGKSLGRVEFGEQRVLIEDVICIPLSKAAIFLGLPGPTCVPAGGGKKHSGSGGRAPPQTAILYGMRK